MTALHPSADEVEAAERVDMMRLQLDFETSRRRDEREADRRLKALEGERRATSFAFASFVLAGFIVMVLGAKECESQVARACLHKGHSPATCGVP